MAERRKNKKRNHADRGGIRVLSRLLYLLAALSAVLIAAVVFFRVDKVEVSGSMRYEAAEILSVADVQPGDNLFLINKNAMARRMLTFLPYLDEIIIVRELPDGISISVTDCVPVAYFSQDGAYFIIDVKCKVLERLDAPPNLPEMTGLTALNPVVGFKLAVGESERERLTALTRLLAMLHQREMSDTISELDLTGLRYLTVGYEGRIAVRYAYTGDYAYATNRAKLILEQRLLPTEFGILDVSDDDRDAHFLPIDTSAS